MEIKNSTKISELSEDIYNEIMKIKNDYGYSDITDDFSLGGVLDNEYCKAKFYCHDNAMAINDVKIEEAAIVTGFGPTNTPTAGTLSVIMKAVSMQREMQIYTDIVISELGAWNSRNIPLPELVRNAEKFKEFIGTMDFNFSNGNIRTHVDKDNLATAGIISKIMTEDDFRSNKEATDILYDLMNLRGSFLGIMVDGLYTVSDILNPIFSKGKNRVLVLAGIEEHYFSQLARIALNRIDSDYNYLLNDRNVKLGALYTKLVGGLYPYPKMSKSIPDSAINLSDTDKELYNKMVINDPKNDHVIMQMIELVSDWSAIKIGEAQKAYNTNGQDWIDTKESYFEYMKNINSTWQGISSKVDRKIYSIANVYS